MKKIYYLLAGMMMLLAASLTPQKALAAETIRVTPVADITDVQNVSSTNYEVGTGAYSKVVQFTLSKPSYVYVSAFSTVQNEYYDNLGNIRHFAVYSDANCSNLVNNDVDAEIYADRKVSKYFCLDAGTYWVHFAKDIRDHNAEDSYGEFRLSVAAQSVNLTATKNGSKARAKAISADKSVTGFLSSSTRTSWFKFTVAEGTTARVSASLENPMGIDNFPLSTTGVTVYKSTNKLITCFNLTEHTYYQTAASSDMTLSAGTYYIAVTGNESYGGWDKKTFTKNAHRNMGKLNLRVSTMKRPGLSKLSNAKGKKIQVTFKSVAGAKGYEVQYSTNSKFKKGNKVVKVNGAKATKATISKLTKKKTYYVRVRAFRTEDGKKLTSGWSASKKVKVNK